MYMIEQAGFSKRNRLVSELAKQIRSGRLATGERLPGENELAQRYQVSRGTVRSALAELQRHELIATQSGVGSFVTFDGVPLDQHSGWATALADSGFEITTELLGIDRVRDQELTERFEIQSFMLIRRLRRDPQAGPVSLELSYIPDIPAFAELPEQGLREDSLTATLASAGLYSSGGEQWISGAPLDERNAELLERAPDTPFLRAVRDCLDPRGGLVEHVVSWLDPSRFTFHLTYGDR
ncbi:GntR family transcriptional regulator [Tamaricihabitans halophyticus]|uniref:GntR family transcriptional regulator n=1 Tax=Tamaricihabitans halophyticus TaxID=1262583 RepID=A0A4R2QME0_9PSEU|nr:GntR family transcriptional regulator [Tamaricihabitans halophyticus]TCP50014.1 GntR family transcriptional regulator [Tamaricihabitans halophyticus]